MLTVKAVYVDGSENVMQTRRVSTRAADRLTSSAPLVMRSVYFQTDDGAEIELYGSGVTIYIMNDNGKTVSVYSLDTTELKVVGGSE